MSKLKKIIFILTLIGSVGITLAIITLKNMPETFDWEDDYDS
jgi:hypothetical protein